MKKKKDMKKPLLAAVLACSMVQIPAIPVAAAAPENLALNQTVTASSYEQPTNNPEKTSPSKAVDGDLTTRWGTAQNLAANEWINVNLGSSKQIQQININFERTDDAQNILGYKVEIANGNDTYTEIYRKEEKAKQKEVIKLTSPVSATDVKVTILSADAGTINWVNVGINEIEIYGSINNDYSLSDVAGMITGGTTIAADVADFPMPTVPEGFNIRINGADFEQIISRDGKIVHPLTDKTVKVSYVITKEETGQMISPTRLPDSIPQMLQKIQSHPLFLKLQNGILTALIPLQQTVSLLLLMIIMHWKMLLMNLLLITKISVALNYRK